MHKWCQQKTCNYIQYLPNLVATRPRASVCDRPLAGTAGSKRAGGGGFDVCLFVKVVCCQVEVSVSGWSLIQGSPTEDCVHETPSIRNPWPIRAVVQWKKNTYLIFNNFIYEYRQQRWNIWGKQEDTLAQVTEQTDCKGIKYNTSFGQKTGLQKKLNATGKT